MGAGARGGGGGGNRGLARRVAPVALFGFLVNCKPSEAFLARFLAEARGLSEAQLDSVVWPAFAYGSLVLLIPVGLLADAWGYRRVVAVGLGARLGTRLVLATAPPGVGWAVLAEVLFALATACDPVFFAYIFQVVPEADYVRAAAAVGAMFHLGNVLGSLFGQGLVWGVPLEGDGLAWLFYASLAFTALGGLCLALFPPELVPPPPSIFSLARGPGGAAAVARELRILFEVPTVQTWSLFWLFGLASALLALNYYQTQLYLIDPETPFGLAEAAIEAAAVAGALGPVAPWLRLSLDSPASLLGGTALLEGALYLGTLADRRSVWLALVCNCLAIGFFYVLYTAAQAAIAAHLPSKRLSIVLTCNTFGALLLLSAVQAVASSARLKTSGYYVVAAGLQAALALAVGAHALLLKRGLGHLYQEMPERLGPGDLGGGGSGG